MGMLVVMVQEYRENGGYLLVIINAGFQIAFPVKPFGQFIWFSSFGLGVVRS